MQSFASPLPSPPHKNHAPQIKHHILYHAPQKGCNYHESTEKVKPTF